MTQIHAPIVLLTLSLGLTACGDDGGDGGGVADARPSSTADAQTTGADGAPAVDASILDGGLDAMGSDAGDVVASEVVINEVLLDQAANSDTDEFAELKGMPNTDYSALTLLQIDGDNGTNINPGLVLSAHPGCMTDANGHCEIVVAANTFENGSQTLLLVSGSTAVADTTDIDAANDGVIDNAAWGEVLDGVAIFDNKPVDGNTDFSYAGAVTLTKVVANNG